MDNGNAKTLSLACPSCGGKMEPAPDGKTASCPYCGHAVLIRQEDPARKEYERRMAQARAEEDIRALRERKLRRRRLRGWLIAVCVIAGCCLITAALPDSPMRALLFPQTADPFAVVSVKFSGMSGEGRAELRITGRGAADYADPDRFQLAPDSGLSNGDTVTVKARTAPGWRFVPEEKRFTVEGLTEWVTRTEQIPGDSLSAIHGNTERLIREDWADILASDSARDMTFAPYRMYLFVDDGSSYERNVLYDAYEVNVTRSDGSVFTGYEACRYADLKLPADGVLTADYGSLMGFNFGYTQGFSYYHSFSGWTDAAEMEADLRHVRDGYRLAD